MSSRSRGRRAAVLIGALAAISAARGPDPDLERGGARDTAAERLPYRDASLSTAQRVQDLLGRMTLEEKVGQMTQAERGDVAADPSLVTTWRLGSVLSGGGSVPADNTPAGWADMVDSLQAAALDTRLGIPLLYGVDSVHGHGNLNGATVFPHNIGLGATRDPALVRRIGHITAEETRASGPQWSFAPCVCVARDDRWGRTYESFGEDPKLVISHGDRHRRASGPAPAISTTPTACSRPRSTYAGDGLTTYVPKTDGSYPIDQGVDEVSRRTFAKLALSPYPRGDPPPPRRLGHAVVLERRLDRGRTRQPGEDARQPAS